MIRIVGVQRSEDVTEEFVLLQNQGSMRVSLRGHALVSEGSIRDGDETVVILADEIDLMPGQYALVRSCSGQARWSHTPDGYHIFYTYAGRRQCLWARHWDPIHILAPQHTYCERSVEPLLV